MVRITAAGTVVWYLLDYQNSVIGMIDSTGSSLGSITYDGFGNILTNTTGVNGDRYDFTSREWDSAVNLQYNRARYYDPNLGKWTSADPLGFEAGDANLYRYVGNGPTDGIDSSGLQLLRSLTNAYVTTFINTDPPPIDPPPAGKPFRHNTSIEIRIKSASLLDRVLIIPQKGFDMHSFLFKLWLDAKRAEILALIRLLAAGGANLLAARTMELLSVSSLIPKLGAIYANKPIGTYETNIEIVVPWPASYTDPVSKKVAIVVFFIEVWVEIKIVVW